jgi:hypothetical protein
MKLAAALAVGALALVPSTAIGASPEALCQAEGGVYTKVGSVATCTESVGSSDNTKVTDQKGSFNSSHDESYTNPGENLPPGQQGGNEIGN